MRCHGSRQKPALRRSCSRCSPEGRDTGGFIKHGNINNI